MRTRFFLSRFYIFLVAIFGAAAHAQTALTVAPQELNFALVAGSGTTATGNFAVALVNGDGPFTATVRYMSPQGGWLSISPSSGTTPSTITVTANASQLPPGTHTAQIAVAAGGFGRVVNVTLVVGSAAGLNNGTLVVNPSAVTILASGTDPTTPANIMVTTPPGAAPLTFRAVSSVPWISLPPVQYTTPATVSVVAYQTGLQAGVYSGAISLIPVGAGTPTIVPIFLKTGATTVQGRVILDQTSVQLNYQLGTALPPAVDLAISTNLPSDTPGGPARQYTASTNTSWLRLRSTLTFTPSQELHDFTFGTLTLLIDPTGLSAGTYTGNVSIVPDGLPQLNVPVTLRVSATPQLNAQPSSLALSDRPGASTTATISLTGTGGTALGFVASSTADWLKVNYSATTTPANLTVTTNPSSLAAGTYTASINVVASNGATLSIPVELEVTTTPATSVLFVNPASISMSATRGLADPDQILLVGAETGVAHPFTAAASSNEGWLSVDVVSATTPSRINVRANLALVPGPGTYSGNIIITSLLASQVIQVPVTLELKSNQMDVSPGSLSFVQPGRFAKFDPQTLRITASTPNQAFRFLDVPSWLKVSDLSGVAPINVTLFPDLALLPPGSNLTASIRIQGPNNTLTVPISVALAPPPALTALPEPVALTYALGGPTLPSQVVRVETGGEPNPFSVRVSTDSGRDWLKVTPLTGTTPAEIKVTIDPSQVTTGLLNGTITITLENGSGQVKTLPVMLAVNPPAAVVESVLHGATLAPTPVAPGMMITITGFGFGPVTESRPKPTAAGAYDTKVADTRVLFDGVPAPILYLRSDQINAIAPYSLYGRVSTRLQIEQAGNLWSLPVDLRVVDSAPGLFTQGGSGRGQASAFNLDATPNSALNPVERGGVVTVFGTGEGQTDAPGQDGRIISSDLRRPLLSVTATIGGKPAEVLYAGSAPGAVSGTFQVNLRVPQDVTPGAVPVQIQVGTATSPATATIVVK